MFLIVLNAGDVPVAARLPEARRDQRGGQVPHRVRALPLLLLHYFKTLGLELSDIKVYTP